MTMPANTYRLKNSVRDADHLWVSQSAPSPKADGTGGPVKVMKLRYAGKCGCGQQLPAGSWAGWNSITQAVICEQCLSPLPLAARPIVTPEPLPPAAIDIGRPGASLVLQYQKRVAQRDARVRREHPRIGGLILALSDQPQTTHAFASGAVGEQKAAERIVHACGPSVLFLLNRRLSRGRQGGDVDMIAITSRGIHVIDVKRYVDQTVEVRRSGGFLSPVNEQLVVGGRDKTKLLESIDRQVEAVHVALADCAAGSAYPITPSLCFVDADLPLVRNRNLQIRGVLVLSLRETTKLLTRSTGSLTVEQREFIHAYLADRMPAA